MIIEVRKRAKVRNRYNQAPHVTEDINGKVTTSQLDITNESEEVIPFPAGDLKKTHLWYNFEFKQKLNRYLILALAVILFRKVEPYEKNWQRKI